MTITELIETLRQAKKLHGDAEVVVATGDDQEMTLHRLHNIERDTHQGQTVLDARVLRYCAS